jgi:hypothetical protein
MNDTPDLNELLAKRPRLGRKGRWDAATTAARHKEQGRRAAKAQSRAQTALTYLYPDDFRALWKQAYAQVKAESGPLPGDPPTNGDKP